MWRQKYYRENSGLPLYLFAYDVYGGDSCFFLFPYSKKGEEEKRAMKLHR